MKIRCERNSLRLDESDVIRAQPRAVVIYFPCWLGTGQRLVTHLIC